jgi:hypothetical protein
VSDGHSDVKVAMASETSQQTKKGKRIDDEREPLSRILSKRKRDCESLDRHTVSLLVGPHWDDLKTKPKTNDPAAKMEFVLETLLKDASRNEVPPAKRRAALTKAYDLLSRIDKELIALNARNTPSENDSEQSDTDVETKSTNGIAVAVAGASSKASIDTGLHSPSGGRSKSTLNGGITTFRAASPSDLRSSGEKSAPAILDGPVAATNVPSTTKATTSSSGSGLLATTSSEKAPSDVNIAVVAKKSSTRWGEPLSKKISAGRNGAHHEVVEANYPSAVPNNDAPKPLHESSARIQTDGKPRSEHLEKESLHLPESALRLDPIATGDEATRPASPVQTSKHSCRTSLPPFIPETTSKRATSGGPSSVLLDNTCRLASRDSDKEQRPTLAEKGGQNIGVLVSSSTVTAKNVQNPKHKVDLDESGSSSKLSSKGIQRPQRDLSLRWEPPKRRSFEVERSASNDTFDRQTRNRESHLNERMDDAISQKDVTANFYNEQRSKQERVRQDANSIFQSNRKPLVNDVWINSGVPSHAVTVKMAADRSPTFSGSLSERGEINLKLKLDPLPTSISKSLPVRLKKWDPFFTFAGPCRCTLTVPAGSTDATKTGSSLRINLNTPMYQEFIRKIQPEMWGKPRQGALKWKKGDWGLMLRALPLSRTSKNRADCHLWPKGTFLQLNGKPLRLAQRQQQSHDKSLWKNQCTQLDLTEHVSMSDPNVSIEICCYDEEPFILMVGFCRYESADSIFSTIRNPNTGLLNRVTVKEGMQRAIQRASGQMHIIDGSDGEKVEEVGKFVFSLTCPISKALMNSPVRGRSCKHWQVCDYMVCLLRSILQFL